MSSLKRIYLFAAIIAMLFSTNLLAQTTIDIEAEDYLYNEDPDSTWKVIDEASASGGKILKQVNAKAKKKQAVGWKITTTSATDTTYYLWYYAKLGNRGVHSTGYTRHYVNLDGDTTTAGNSWPFQYFNNTAVQEEIANDDTLAMHWYQNHSGGGAHDSISIQPGEHVIYLRQRDGRSIEIDKLRLTNDLTWKPTVTYEWEAEDTNWALAEPLEVVADADASGGWAVAPKAGSGAVASTDILNGNLDAGFRNGRVANDEVYLWARVNLPSDAANSFWIGTGDDAIIPPSWEGTVTTGYQWQKLNEDPLPLGTNSFNKFHDIRIKQQEEGTKIDKYLMTNDASYVPPTTVGVEDETFVATVPDEFSVAQNYPNPFNPTTVISFALPKEAHVNVSVFNALGQKVEELVNGSRNAGLHNVTFDASNLTTGIYFYTVNAGEFVSTKKMLLVK